MGISYCLPMDDADHFYAPALLGAIQGQRIIGPPSVAYPLLAGTGFDPTSLQIVYPPNLESPVEIQIGDLGVKVYHANHFNGWEPVHISFLLKYRGKRIYVTGDSNTFYFDDTEIHGIDALIYSMVPKKLRSTSAQDHAMELIDIQGRLEPKYIVGNHLIGCEWTVSPVDLKNALEMEGAQNILVPESDQEVVLV